MLQLWDQVLHLLSFVVTPDWGSLIGVLPIGLALIVLAYLAWTVGRLFTAPPTRRGRRRLPPRVPEGVHMGPPSLAPLLVSASAAILFFGIVFRGPVLVAGLVAIVLSLLYWGGEAMRDYDRLVHHELVPLGAGEAAVLAPPPGVHLPGPSFRPLLVSLAAAVLFFGLVMGPAILVAGVLMLVTALLGWLTDARREYRAVELADRSGQLESEQAPRYPVGTLVVFGVFLAAALVVQAGIFPPREAASSAGGPTASTAAGGGAASPAASGASGGGGGLTITAQNIAFDPTSATAPANAAFTLTFDNKDQGVPHNIEIKSASGTSAFKGDLVTGPATAAYHVPALPAGSYTFVCDVHPNMTGTLTVK
ncbi:MAG TPA: cupredoxin domain-containing protein [Candidatus Limnocylindrales bacterium]